MEEIVVLKRLEETEKGHDLDLLGEAREEMKTVAEKEEVDRLIKGQDHLVASAKVELDQAPVVQVDLRGVALAVRAQVVAHPLVPILHDPGHETRKILEINQEKKNLSRGNQK